MFFDTTTTMQGFHTEQDGHPVCKIVLSILHSELKTRVQMTF